MSSENFANESPAFAVLYHPVDDNGSSARIVDLNSHIVSAEPCNLTKAQDAYAVLYTPQPDGKWLAEIVDLPGCSATRPEIAQARIGAKALAMKVLGGHKARGEPAPPAVTFCHYTRPTDAELNRGVDRTIVEEVADAVANLVDQHRREQGTTPQASTLCGYVSLSSHDKDEAGEEPERG